MLRLATLAPDSPIPVVSYARISADLKKDEHGVRDQHRMNHETAKRQGWTVVHEFTDNDKSASKVNVVRDDFEAMVSALRAGQLADGTPVRGVVVVADDRLARRPGDYERFVEAFTLHEGFVFADYRQVKNLYSEDVESMGLYSVVGARIEARKIARRMRDSHRNRASEGRPVGGHRPFGWQADRRTLAPVESRIIQEAAREFIGGRSLNSIVGQWRKSGVRTPRGNEWSVQTLRVMFTSPRLCGWRLFHGEIMRDADGEPIVGEWTPILTQQEWHAVQAIINSRRGRRVGVDGVPLGPLPLPGDAREVHYLLTGFLRCGRPTEDGGICGKSLRVTTPKNSATHRYACQAKGSGGCGGISRRGDLVDFFISELVLNRMAKKAAFNAPQESMEWAGRDELKDAMEQLAMLREQWHARNISNQSYFHDLPILEKKINGLRSEKAKHDAAVKRQEVAAAIDVDDIRRRWYLPEEEGGLPLSQKRAHIRADLITVIIHSAGPGRRAFDPNLLEPVWREE
ncbi:recombinase family protein [Streptosporangium sp. CA-135522]|uniref:recombinase family protein n=1 Tax=Streptosporangium sp. CA-135522 TaxID=3240072 RepID=UPI003D8C1D46